jgi:hypothetical protein
MPDRDSTGTDVAGELIRQAEAREAARVEKP